MIQNSEKSNQIPQRPRQKRAMIVGFGAMGHLGGLYLSHLGYRIYVHRQNEVDKKSSILTPEGLREFTTWRADRGEILELDVVYLAVKAFDIEKAWQEFVTTWGRVICPVLVVANGAVWPLLTRLADEYSSFAWYLGLSTVGVTCKEQFEITSQLGKVVFGPLIKDGSSKKNAYLSESLVPLTSIDRVDGLEISWIYKNDIKEAYYRKLLINVVLNTLCAAKRLRTNSEALLDKSLLWDLHGEVYTWFRHTANPAYIDLIDLDSSFHDLEDVIKKTADNENSMARDVRKGKKTEKEFLVGAMLSEPQAAKLYPKMMLLAECFE